MISKISFFNKTIFKKNFTHYWPLWVANLIYMILVLPVNLWQYMKIDYYDDSLSQVSKQYLALNNVLDRALNPIPVVLFAIAAVMAVFSYLYTARNTNMIHSLPVTRLELFTTNLLSGFLFLAISEIIAFISAVFVGIGFGITSIQYLFFWLLYMVGITFFFVSFSILIAMLTGNLLAMPVYCLVVNFLYVGCLYMICTIIGNVNYGISLREAWQPGKSCILSPLYYLGKNVGCSIVWDEKMHQASSVNIKGGSIIAIYAVTAVVLLVAAYQIYKRRQLETAGDIVAISVMKPVFRWGAAICGGVLLSNLLLEIFRQGAKNKGNFWYLLICVLLIGTICYWAAEMLMQKNFRVFQKKRILEWLAAAAVSAIILGIFKVDVFGIEKKLPNPEEVERAYICMDYPIQFSGQEIVEIEKIHQQIIDAKEEYSDLTETDENAFWATFRYYLKNGKVFERSYVISVSEEDISNENTPSGRILTMESDPENLKKSVFGSNYQENEYFSGYLELYGEEGNYEAYHFDKEELDQIVEAAMKDIEEGNYGKYMLYSAYTDEDSYYNAISLSYYNQKGIHNESDEYYMYEYMMDEEFITDYTYGYGGSGSIYLNFGEKCTNLINTLENLGIVNENQKLYTYEEYEEICDW